MKRFLSLILAIVMTFTLSTVAFAETNQTKLTCTASNNQLNPGDYVTLTLSLQNVPNAKSVALVFDYDVSDTFSLVSGNWLLSGALLANFDSKTTACGTAAIAYMSATNVNGNIFELKLKVKDSALPGEKDITVSPVIKNDSTTIQCDAVVKSVTILSAACTHASKTYVEEKNSTTQEKGWDAYYRCNNCAQLFASNGTTEISEIPYRPLLTSSSDTVLSCATIASEVHPGEEVEITLSLNNAPNAKSIALVFNYDVSDTFTLVNGEWLLSGALLANFDSKTTACGTAAIAYMSSANVNGNIFKLKLKVKETPAFGETEIVVSPVIKNDSTTIDCDNASITLTVAEFACQHSNKVHVAAKASSCKEQGWDEYYYCEDCDQLFAADEVTEIDEVPFRPFSGHIGGEATCKSLAICTVCGQSYGSIDPNNHKGETETKNAVEASCLAPGYTGDVYCKDCGQMIRQGTLLNALAHTPAATVKENEIPATYENDGSYDEVVYCSICQTEISRETKVIPQLSDPIKIIIESKNTVAEKEFSVDVEIQNNSGFSYLELTPIYPGEFTLVSVQNGELISDFTKGKQYIWITDEDVLSNGKLMTFTFTTSRDIEPGEYEIGFNVRSCVNYEEKIVNVIVEAGTVEILSFTYGDANGDNIVNGQDIVRLKKYLANYDYDTGTSTIEIFAGADANGDGSINGQDVVRLKKYLANYDYETETSTIVLGPQK